jgi:hypothetical protein
MGKEDPDREEEEEEEDARAGDDASMMRDGLRLGMDSGWG